MKGLPALACAALVALGAGCASLPLGLEAPAVSVADIGYLGGNLFEQRFALSLRITNPNRMVLEIEGASFTVDVNGKQFARGVSDQPFSLPALGETVVELPATSSLHQLVEQFSSPGAAKGLEYRISGKLLLGGYGALPFRREGRIGMPGPLPAPERGRF